MDLTKLHLHWGESRYKGKVYRSYSLAKTYRQDGKNLKEVVLKLGKLSSEEAARWHILLETIKKTDSFVTTLADIVVVKHFNYLDVAVANVIWNKWKLDDAFGDDGKRKLGVSTIARILALNRCIDPATKSQTPEWLNKTALPWLLDLEPELVNPSRIFRELDAIDEYKESICKHLFEQISRADPNSMKSVFFDLSSTTFAGSQCVLMKWGHCKEGYHNHVVLALVVNQQGLPFYWEVLPGGTADSKTIVWLLSRLKERFKINETTLVFDRGMVSDDNLALLETSLIKYISAMDKSQLESITGLDFKVFSHLDPDGTEMHETDLPDFAKLNNETFYREVKVVGKRRYILCFNPQLFKDQRHGRKKAVADLQSFVEELNVELSAAKKSRQRKTTSEKFTCRLVKDKLADFVSIKLRLTNVKGKSPDGSEYQIRTYRGTVCVDEGLMLHAGRLDGFWLLVTNHSEMTGAEFIVSAPNAIGPYRDKVLIEAAFRDIKSFVEVAPVHVWTEAHVKAHFTICILSHFINRILTLQLHKNLGKLTRQIVSHEKLFAELSGCMIDRIEVENVHLATYSMTRPTAEQRELLSRVDSESLLSFDVVEKAKTSINN
jgi:transposase